MNKLPLSDTLAHITIGAAFFSPFVGMATGVDTVWITFLLALLTIISTIWWDWMTPHYPKIPAQIERHGCGWTSISSDPESPSITNCQMWEIKCGEAVRWIKTKRENLKKEREENLKNISHIKYEAEAKLAAERKDAERYRWLRQKRDSVDIAICDENEDGDTGVWYQHAEDGLDAAIDSALSAFGRDALNR